MTKVCLDKQKAILLLRFRVETPSKKSLTYMTYPKIEKLTGIHVNRVKYICWKAVNRVTIDKRNAMR